MHRVRFWTWHNDGWVRLSLTPGRSLETHCSSPTDEGWHSSGMRWALDAHGTVTREWCENGRDCDGGYSRAGEDYCRVWNLEDRAGHDGTPIPAWIDAGSECRDEYAEAAGY